MRKVGVGCEVNHSAYNIPRTVDQCQANNNKSLDIFVGHLPVMVITGCGLNW